MPGATLCLFAKAPVAGQSKTRLASALGAAGAAALARAFLLDALSLWESGPEELLVVHAGEMDSSLQARFASLHCVPQAEGDLGERMERGLRAGLAQSEVAIAVGTDIPELGRAQVQEALRKLADCDAVLGPAEDGGFYLLALRQCPPGLLRGLPWSRHDTLEKTVQRLESAGMRVAMLDPLFDVDLPAELGRLGQLLRGRDDGLDHTRAFLRSPENQAISVIVPVLDEEKRLPSLLRSLTSRGEFAEIIVVDGGSRDRSVSVAQGAPGVQVLQTSPGRARQLNAGAALAMGGTLLFLHADTQLPEDAGAQIRACMGAGRHCAGAFALRTDYDPKGHHRPWVEPFLRLADMRSRYTRYPYGDQALFVRTQTFRALGGYPDLPLFEDLALSVALHRVQPLASLQSEVHVSGRRFQERPFYYLALMNSFPLLYRLGVPAERLSRFYRDTR